MMHHGFDKPAAWVCVVAGLAVGLAEAQTIVVVGRNQTLTRADLEAGVFNGRPFVLGPGTTFRVLLFGRVSIEGSLPAGFDLGGSTIEVNDGGRIVGNTGINGATIELLAGGTLSDGCVLGEDASLFVRGTSSVNRLTLSSGARMEVLSGNVSGTVTVHEGASLALLGGRSGRADVSGTFAADAPAEAWIVSLLGDGSAAIRGGRVDTVSGEATTVIDMRGGVVNRIQTAGRLDLSGGVVSSTVALENGAHATVTGGDIASFAVPDTARLELVGNEFRLDNRPIDGAPPSWPGVGVTAGSIVTGTLVSGDPFGVVLRGPDEPVAASAVELVLAEVPPIAAEPIIVDSGTGPSGFRPGERVIVRPGGSLPDGALLAWAGLTVEGGVVGSSLDGFGADVVIAAGQVGDGMRLTSPPPGSAPRARLSLLGGSLGSYAEIVGGYDVAISGGSIGFGATFRASEVVLVGGAIDDHGFFSDSNVSMSDGSIGDRATFGSSGSDVSIARSLVDLTGGSVGDESNFVRVEVRLDGGSIGSGATFRGNPWRSGSDTRKPVTLTDGRIGSNARFALTDVRMTGGEIGDGARFQSGATLHASGGVLGDDFISVGSSRLAISGGLVGERLSMTDSELELTVTQASIGGAPVEVTAGAVVEVLPRSGEVLAVVLADGTPAEFTLNGAPTPGEDAFVDSTIRLIGAVAPCGPADLNRDGTLDLLDIVLFGSAFAVDDLSIADVTGDGAADIFDVLAYFDRFALGC